MNKQNRNFMLHIADELRYISMKWEWQLIWKKILHSTLNHLNGNGRKWSGCLRKIEFKLPNFYHGRGVQESLIEIENEFWKKGAKICLREKFYFYGRELIKFWKKEMKFRMDLPRSLPVFWRRPSEESKGGYPNTLHDDGWRDDEGAHHGKCKLAPCVLLGVLEERT